MRSVPSTAALALALSLALSLALAAPATAQHSGYEAYYGYLGTYPDETNPGFHVDVQGVTHDDDYWYFTNSELIYRVALGEDLANEPVLGQIEDIADTPALSGYDHFGDLTHYDGHLLIPVTDLDDVLPPILAVYEGVSLDFVGSALLLDDHAGPVQAAAWIAVDDEGYVYAPHAGGEVLYRYDFEWDQLPNVALDLPVEVIRLKDFDGMAPFTTPSPQGGVFSPTGEVLYISSGATTGSPGTVCEGSHTTEEMWAKAGINVFDTESWTRIRHSSSGSGTFNYAFEPGWPDCEEPEGLTIWDIPYGQAPGSVHGQLHVLLLDNDYGGPADPDDVFLKHYTNRVNVNPFVPSHPYKTIAQGLGFAWDGSILIVESATYPESLTMNKRVRVEANGGPVVIGG